MTADFIRNSGKNVRADFPAQTALLLKRDSRNVR